MGKKQINTHYLNFGWDYIPNYDKSYIKEFPKSIIVNLPHTNIEVPYNNFSNKLYQFISSYQNKFDFSKIAKKRYILHFDGVMAYAEVYLNNKLITSHKGGYTPFRVDITSKLKNGENKLFVMCDSTEREDFPPHGFVTDCLTYGGIYKEVYIEEKEVNYIDNAFVHVENDDLNIRLFLNIQNAKDTVFKFNIYKEDQLAYFFEREYDLKKKEVLVLEKVYLDLWSIDEPNMYELEIIMNDIVAFKTRFANRQVSVTADGFFFNGEHIKLIGLNRHQSFPYVGYAMPSNAQKKDADILKYDLGCNVVRCSHYPPSKYFLDRCDEIGLLVFNEIPGERHIGNKAWQQIAIENVKDMIYRDYNHPSVFMWGTRINGSNDNDDFYTVTNSAAKSYDKTRPTSGARSFAGSRLIEDVYSYNDFIHDGKNKGLNRVMKITKINTPYLVSDHNGYMYPTKKFDDEKHRENQVKRHLEVLNYTFRNRRIIGSIGSCMTDYNTHKEYGSGDSISYHGIMDMFRIPKDVSGVYRSQNSQVPYLSVVSSFNVGDRESRKTKEVILLSNVDYVKYYINDEFVGDYYPSNEYSSLPHPPIIIDDFIGNQVHENENYNSKEADLIKEILLFLMKNDGKLSIRLKLKKMFFILKNRKKNQYISELYEKYVLKIGLEPYCYRFEGIIDQIVVVCKKFGLNDESDLFVCSDDEVLSESTTYETTRVVVKHLDKHQNPLVYSNEVITIKVNGPLEVIGPNRISLIGGSIAFYVKTTAKTGPAKLTISSNNYPDKHLNIEVI